MKKWLGRIRGAVGMGLTWALGWAPIGAVVGLTLAVVSGGSLGAFVDTWVKVMVLLGFLGGAIFSTVLSLVEGRRRFDELSLPRFAAWGAFGGLMLSAFAVAAGLVIARFAPALWLPNTVITVMVGLATLLGAGSAAGSLALARRADDRELLEAGKDLADVGLSETESRELLGT